MAIELAHQDLQRTARVLLPPLWKADFEAHGERPVLFVFHDEDVELTRVVEQTDTGFATVTLQGDRLCSGDAFEEVARFSDLVFSQDNVSQHLTTTQNLDKGRFIVVLVDGVSPSFDPLVLPDNQPLGSFNSGHRGRDAIALDVDDVAFVQAIYTELYTRLTADLGSPALNPALIFAAGMGNGGEMAYRLGSQWLVNGIFPLRGIAAVHASNGGFASDTGLPQAPAASLSRWPMLIGGPKVLAVGGRSNGDFFMDVTPTTAAVPSASKQTLMDELGFDVALAPRSFSVRSSLEQALSVYSATTFVLWVEPAFPATSLYTVIGQPYIDPAFFGFGLPASEVGFLIEQEMLGHVWPRRGTSGTTDTWDGARAVWDYFAAQL